MADNVVAPFTGSGDATAHVRTKDRSGVETQIVGLDLSPGSGSETLMTGTLPVSGTLAIGTGATDLGKAEDAAHTSGDVGVLALGVRKDTAAATAGTDGDYQPAIFDANGRMHVNGSGVTQPVSLASGATAIAKAEDVASADA